MTGEFDDEWKRVTSLAQTRTGQVFETFAYDEIGNLTGYFDGSTTWTYGDAEFSQVPSRNGGTGDSQDLKWDSVGRLQHAVDLGSTSRAEVFSYDGAGRQAIRPTGGWGRKPAAERDPVGRQETADGVSRVSGTSPSARRSPRAPTPTTSTTGCDGDAHRRSRPRHPPDRPMGGRKPATERDPVGRQERADAARGPVYRFGGERVIVPENGAVLVDGPQLISSVLPMLSVADGDFRWRFVEPDGHALETLSADGTTLSVEVAGSYGKRFSSLSSGTWPVDGFHGSDPDSGLSHMGARHMRTGDGLWMQPEPLLYLGMTNGDLRRPLGYGGVYAAGSPWALEDRSGRFPQAVAAGGAAVAAPAVVPALAIVGAVATGAAIGYGVHRWYHLGSSSSSSSSSAPSTGRSSRSPREPDGDRPRPTPVTFPTDDTDAGPVDGGAPRERGAEHRKNKRPSNKPKHEEGETRRQRDAGGEKGDENRRVPRKKPPNHKGPWPPKKKQE